MTFRSGDVIRAIASKRLAKVVNVMPSGRVDVYMLGSGAFIPYSRPELWELVERPESMTADEISHTAGATVIDPKLIDVIRRQALALGNLTAALGQIQWFARNYVIGNIKTTEHELRRVLRDIDQTTILAGLGESIAFSLKGSYEDIHHNPFPPSHTASETDITQEG